MSTSRGLLVPGLVVLCVALTLVGCPKPKPPFQLALLSDTEVVTLGSQDTEVTFHVSKVYSSVGMAPLEVSSPNPWIEVVSGPGQISTGPDDKIAVTLRVNRALLTVGLNEGTVQCGADGIVPLILPVRIFANVIANFTALNTTVFIGDTVQFFDTSQVIPGQGTIQSWAWDFGDGVKTTSTEQNPSHIYTETNPADPTFDVTLVVMTENETSTAVKKRFITVLDPTVPTALFTVNPGQPVLGQLVQFTFTGSEGIGADPVTFAWDFGDGNSSTEKNPVHRFTSVGTFPVELTVARGVLVDAVTVNVQVVIGTLPTADFTTDNTNVLTIDTVQFINLSTDGSLPITDYFWDFGDGIKTTSTEENPTHTYTVPGTYTVSLMVTAPNGSDTVIKADFITVNEATQLDLCVREPDNNFDADIVSQIPGTGVTGFVYNLISQSWREYSEVDRTEWKHFMTIIKPDVIQKTKALMVVARGEYVNGVPPDTIDPAYSDLARTSGAIVAVLKDVPSQPISFTGDAGSPRSDHDLVAYSLSQYMDDPTDGEWPLVCPMVKSVLRAMDTVQSFYMGGSNIDSFVVTGDSKRAWTSLLTSAVDPRVEAVIPVAWDAINWNPHFSLHQSVYGGFTPSWDPYEALDVLSDLPTAAGQALIAYADPFSYRTRLIAKKFFINATGDDFFVPDAAQFYVGANALAGSTYLNYLPNRDHGIAMKPADVKQNIAAIFRLCAEGFQFPQIQWDVLPPGDRLRVTTLLGIPDAVMLYVANSPDRDFRESELPGDWSASVLPEDSPNSGIYTTDFIVPLTDQWAGFFIALTYNQGTQNEFTITTEVVVTPTTFP
jgi:PhoPQ-activated pathogenicity-related protein